MAVGTKADFAIYDEEFQSGFIEVLMQQADAWNEASNGTMILNTDMLKGDYDRNAFFKSIANLVSRRATTGTAATAAATSLKPTQGEIIGVKLNRKIGPVDSTRDAFKKIASDESEFSMVVGQQAAKAMLVDQLNTGLSGLVAAIEGNSMNVAATGANLDYDDLVDIINQFGDASSDVVAFAMHSKPWHDLIKKGIADKVDSVYGAAVFQGVPGTLGRPVIVTDSPSLLVSGTTNTYKTVGLTAGAVQVTNSEAADMVMDRVTGQENIIWRMQGESAYNLKVKGYEWDIANGGENPTDTAVATTTNWDKAATDNKSTAGAFITTN